MIDHTVFYNLRNAVCAVGYLSDPLSQYSKNYLEANQFHAVGTGFVVREEIVLTNRHVIDDLEKEARRAGVPESQHFLLFVIQRKGRVTITPRLIRQKYCLRNGAVDVGFIGFNIVNPDDFVAVRPVTVDSSRTIRVSEEIATLGYPHGNALLEKDGRVSRWGPVLQQGWVSGISPWESLGEPDEFLLDLRAAEGISGSPVFRPDGKVFGVLHSGKGPGDLLTTTAFAQPISPDRLSEWLVEFANEQQSFD